MTGIDDSLGYETKTERIGLIPGAATETETEMETAGWVSRLDHTNCTRT